MQEMVTIFSRTQNWWHDMRYNNQVDIAARSAFQQISLHPSELSHVLVLWNPWHLWNDRVIMKSQVDSWGLGQPSRSLIKPLLGQVYPQTEFHFFKTRAGLRPVQWRGCDKLKLSALVIGCWAFSLNGKNTASGLGKKVLQWRHFTFLLAGWCTYR